MVLGLIDFLLGGKKKTKVPRSGQVTTPLSSVGGAVETTKNSNIEKVTIPDGVNDVTENVKIQKTQEMNFVDSQSSNSSSGSQQQINVGNNFLNGNKKSISEVISKLGKELKLTNEKITTLVTDIKAVENSVNNIGHRLDDLEEAKKVSEDKLSDVDRNMSKFLSLYELINNQYNPFVDKEAPKEVVLDASGSSSDLNSEDSSNESSSDLNFNELIPDSSLNSATSNSDSINNIDSSLLELDTLSIEEAAGDSVPLTVLKNSTNSLVIILSWLEYLIKKVGIEESRNSLRYYTETLRWITPEVFFDLDKYLRGMKDNKDVSEDASLTVRDHIVSLYFISKLNEKVLDEKLTRAVLQIIKQ